MSTVSAALSLERGNKSADVRRDPGRRAPMDKLIWITEQIIVPIIRIHKFMHAFSSDFIPEKSAGELAFLGRNASCRIAVCVWACVLFRRFHPVETVCCLCRQKPDYFSVSYDPMDDA
ncbi:MAG: hypothetical protein IKH57_21575 [Clostridia bacterium]|nr:hypothetical protein [Clostridia bacterium]MBR4578666.1 hypothetical protein [Oscillospiraceae bacterium]